METKTDSTSGALAPEDLTAAFELIAKHQLKATMMWVSASTYENIRNGWDPVCEVKHHRAYGRWLLECDQPECVARQVHET